PLASIRSLRPFHAARLYRAWSCRFLAIGSTLNPSRAAAAPARASAPGASPWITVAPGGGLASSRAMASASVQSAAPATITRIWSPPLRPGAPRRGLRRPGVGTGRLVAADLPGEGGLQVLHGSDVPADGPPQPGPHPARTARFPQRHLKRHLLHANRAEPRVLPLLLLPVPAPLVPGRVPADRNPEAVAQQLGDDPEVGHGSVLLGQLGEQAAQCPERRR